MSKDRYKEIYYNRRIFIAFNVPFKAFDLVKKKLEYGDLTSKEWVIINSIEINLLNIRKNNEHENN